MRASVHDSYREAPEHWWFRARRDIFAKLLARLVVPGLPPADRASILDVGPGSGINLPILAPIGRVTVVDRDAASALACRSEGAAHVVVGDAQRLPLADAAFDLVCGLDVIEHLDDDRAALAEFARVLAPGGRVFVSVPAFAALWGRQDVLSEHRRRYRRAELRARLGEAGFEVERISYFNTLLFPPILAARLVQRPFLRRDVARGRSDLDVRTPGWLDAVLYRSFAAEGGWLAERGLPFGVSLFAVGRR